MDPLIFAVGVAGLAFGFWMGRRTRPAPPSIVELPATPATDLPTPMLFGYPLPDLGVSVADIERMRAGSLSTVLDRTKCGKPVHTSLGYVACLKTIKHPEPCQ